MANLSGFNATEHETTNDFELLPENRYIAVITASQFKDNKAQNNKYLELQFQIIEGEFKNRVVWGRLSLNHQKEQTAKIARGQLAAICKAVGVLTPQDSAELHNLPLQISVKVKRRTDNGELTNEIKGFAPKPSAAAASAPGKPGIAPWKR